MQLNKTGIHRKQQKASAVSQITLDDDYNVPDYRPDIVKVLKEKGELRFDEVKAANGAAWVKGSMIFRVLYRSDQEDGKISCLRGEIPFQEKLNMDGITDYDKVKVSGELEDITIGVINSRKLNVRAVVVLRTTAEEETNQEFTTGLEDGGEYETRTRQQEMLRLVLSERDICRQRSEIILPSSKPNVHEILWKSVELRNIESTLKDREVVINGEVLVALLYAEAESERLQWYETSVPLSCSVEKEAAREDLLYKVKLTPVSMELESKQDYDGEERILVLELALDMELRMWQEEIMPLLEDVYSLKKQVMPVRQMQNLENLRIKNYAKQRLVEQMELSGDQEKILQICACEGTVLVEKKEMQPEGVFVEGILTVELLYITTDDHMPVGTVREIYPFSQLLEVPDAASPARVELDCGIEQLSAAMLDQMHIEIKAVLHMDLFVFDEIPVSNICELQEEPLDIEQLKCSPGLVGYIARPGDSLWEIAKENHTTVADIMETNQLKTEQLTPGDQILIIKKV